MEKDYDAWNAYKLLIENENVPPAFRVREVWWTAIGVNIGIEENGKNETFERPVLVLRKFSKDHFIGLPLSSRIDFNKNYYVVDLYGTKRTILLSHVQTLSAKRLLRYAGRLDEAIFEDVQARVVALLLEKQIPRG